MMGAVIGLSVSTGVLAVISMCVIVAVLVLFYVSAKFFIVFSLLTSFTLQFFKRKGAKPRDLEKHREMVS